MREKVPKTIKNRVLLRIPIRNRSELFQFKNWIYLLSVDRRSCAWSELCFPSITFRRLDDGIAVNHSDYGSAITGIKQWKHQTTTENSKQLQSRELMLEFRDGHTVVVDSGQLFRSVPFESETVSKVFSVLCWPCILRAEAAKGTLVPGDRFDFGFGRHTHAHTHRGE